MRPIDFYSACRVGGQPSWVIGFAKGAACMKPFIFATLGALIGVMMLVGIGGLVVLDVSYTSGRYSNSTQVISERLNVLSVAQGYVSEDGEYFTYDPLMAVTAWYAGRYKIEPHPGMYTQGQCVRLSKVNSYRVIRQTVVVNACSAGRGTQVYFNQTFYLGR
jgi:hypothetical protein